MRHSKVLTVLTASVLLAVTGCSGSEDSAYLGSRDDIIVNNRNMPPPAAAAPSTAMAEAPAPTTTGTTDMAEEPAAAPAPGSKEALIAQARADNEAKIAEIQGTTPEDEAVVIQEEMKAAEEEAMAATTPTLPVEPAAQTSAQAMAQPTGTMSAHEPVTTLDTKAMSSIAMTSPTDMPVPTETPDTTTTPMTASAPAATTEAHPYPAMGTTAMLHPEGVGVTQTAAASNTAPPMPEGYQGGGDIPMNAKPGECYAKVLTPAVVETTKEKVQVSEEQQVLARIVPAKYEVTKEKVLVKEARQYWKQGRGLNEKVDQTTGEILCLVEEPAEYKVIEKRTLIEPEKPEYKMQPAQFETVTKTNVVKPAHMEWQRVLCDTNINEATIMRVQQALTKAGFSVGKIDGQIGNMTMAALRAYQAQNKLPVGNLSYETLERLGVSPAGA